MSKDMGGLAEPELAKQSSSSKLVTKPWLEQHIARRLSEWQFKDHVRYCKVNPTKHGLDPDSDPYQVEHWSNKDLAQLLVEDVVNDLLPSDRTSETANADAQSPPKEDN